MSNYVCELAPDVTLPVVGQAGRYPIRRIFCVGRNYAAHAAEMGAEVDRTAPFYFTVSPAHASLGGKVAYPAGTSDYHHEVECVVALASGGRDIAVEAAEGHIYGYGVGLDMTRRDRQAEAKEKRRPWSLGKDCEGGAIFSCLTPRAAIPDVAAQQISLTKNGVLVQQSALSLMVHNIPELIAHLSSYYCLGAGDIIMTGTPEGVGPVMVGDRLNAEVTGLAPLEVVFT